MLRKKKKKDERGKGILPGYTKEESDKLLHIGSYLTEQRPAPAPPARSGTKKRPELGFDPDWHTPVRITSLFWPPGDVRAAGGGSSPLRPLWGLLIRLGRS